MAAKTTTFADQVAKRRQRLRSLGISSMNLIKTEVNSEFDPWHLIKRSQVESSYSLLLKYRSAIYPTALGNRRSQSNTPARVTRLRRNTESVVTLESDGRSSVQSNITELEGDSSFKEDFDYDAEEIPELPLYPHLVHKPGTYSQELYLKACREFGVPPSKLFYRQLTGETVVLRRQRLAPLEVKACAIALIEILEVHTVDLTENNIGPEGAKYLAELLLENHFIKHLILADNRLGYEGVRTLAEALKTTDSLVSLNISGNRLGDKQAEVIRPLIEDTGNLKHLNISHNQLREEGGKIIGDALLWTDTLENLDISWNHLRRGGVTKLTESLVRNTSLRVLNLSWNGFYTLECQALGKALEKNSSLTELDVSYNRINGKCLNILNGSLKKNTTLQTLKLGHNPLLPDDALGLLRFIHENPNSGLLNLDLEKILVDQPFVDLLDSIRKDRNLTVTYGNLRGPDMMMYDYDEGVLLTEDSWTVIRELGNIIGIDFYTLFTGIEDDIHGNMTPDQIIGALQILLNPLSLRCTKVLVNRLEKNAEGFIDFKHVAKCHERKEEYRTIGRQHSEFNMLKYMTDEEYDQYYYAERQEDDSENPVQHIRQCLFHVMTRKLCGSTEYRREVECNSQDGGEFLKSRILQQYQLKQLGPDERSEIELENCSPPRKHKI